MSRILIAPSVLSADFGNLARDVAAAEDAGADWIHVDVMDGHFVPNLTIGPGVTRAVRRATTLPVDVHLMVESPERLLEPFVEAGADRITVHAETCPHLHRVVARIRELGAKAGVAVNPSTPVDALGEIVPYVDLILIMTVNPGFGGQTFIPTSARKVGQTRRLLEEAGRVSAVAIQVDGGIDAKSAPEVVRKGATVLVAGSSVYLPPGGPAETIPALRAAAERALVPAVSG